MLGVLIESEDKKMHHWDILYSNAPRCIIIKEQMEDNISIPWNFSI